MVEITYKCPMCGKEFKNLDCYKAHLVPCANEWFGKVSNVIDTLKRQENFKIELMYDIMKNYLYLGYKIPNEYYDACERVEKERQKYE